MKLLNVEYKGFSIGARLADELIKNERLNAMKKDGMPVLLHALKGVAFVLKGYSDYGIVQINGRGYATR